MASTHKRYELRGYRGDSGPPKERKKKGKQGPHGPQVFTGECAPVRATECWGVMGDLVSEVRRSQEEFRAQGQLLILPRCWQNLSLQIRKVKSGEGQTPKQKEEELSSPLRPSHPPTSFALSQVNTPVGCHIDTRLAQDQHRGLRVMLEGEAAFRRSWWRKKKVFHGHSNRLWHSNYLPTDKVSPSCPSFPSFPTLGASPTLHLLSGVPRMLAFQPLLSPPAQSRLVSQSGLWGLLS